MPNQNFAIVGLVASKFDRTGLSPVGLPEFALGTEVQGNNGGRWIYVQAAGPIAQYDAVGIAQPGFQAASVTKAMADAGYTLSAAQAPFNAGDYGWVALSGRSGLRVNTLTGTAANVALYTTTTPGALSSTAASQTQVKGVVATVPNSSGATASAPVLANSFTGGP